MARRIIIGTGTWSSQANRDAALTRLNTALSGYVYTGFTSAIPAGINTPTATTLTISIEVEDREVAFDLASAIYNAWTSSNRQTSGYMSVNRI